MKACNFIQFYRFNPDVGGFVESVGSDGVAYMDGRWGTGRMHAEARVIGEKRGFDGYRICQGTHTNPHYLTATIQPVRPEKRHTYHER